MPSDARAACLQLFLIAAVTGLCGCDGLLGAESSSGVEAMSRKKGKDMRSSLDAGAIPATDQSTGTPTSDSVTPGSDSTPPAPGNTITAASASYEDVSAAVAAAGRGDTVLVPPGAESWPSVLTLTQGISLRGAGIDKTTLTRGDTLIAIEPDSAAIANDETIRVEGFTFDGAGSALKIVTVSGAGPAGKPFKNLAIGHNKFQNAGTTTAGNGAIATVGQVRGAIFSNVFDRCNVILKIMGNDVLAESLGSAFPFAYGNDDNLFFETNTIKYSSPYAGGDPGWTETGQGARLVMRYNVWDLANVTGTELQDIHGFQNWLYGTNNEGQTGTMISEYYGNTYTNTSGYRWLGLRGGWGLFFNNVATGSIGPMQINQYYDGVASGSGCPYDVPGAYDHSTNQILFHTEVNNSYIFNNTRNGTISPIQLGLDGCGVAENSHFWNFNPACTASACTAGIGRGTAPPTGSCAAGTAFWVNSDPNPTTNPGITQAGVLYKCMTANVWSLYYKPYLYPHPLAD